MLRMELQVYSLTVKVYKKIEPEGEQFTSIQKRLLNDMKTSIPKMKWMAVLISSG